MTAPGAPTAAPPAALARLTAPLLSAAGVLGATAVLYVRNPHQSGSYGFCPWNVLTGGYCPGCGGLRAVHDLAHGDLAAAASSNLLLVALLPVAVLLWAGWARSRWRGRPRPFPGRTSPYARPALWSVAVVVLAFTALRNTGDLAGSAGLALGAWLAP
jgi:hypothetical protein